MTLSLSSTIENMPSGVRSWIMSRLSLFISMSRLSGRHVVSIEGVLRCRLTEFDRCRAVQS